MAYALPDKKASTVAAAFLETCFLLGFPRHVTSDRGSEFVNSTMNEVNERFKVHAVHTTAYRPQSNGKAEVTNGKLIGRVRCSINDLVKTPGEWDQLLGPALFCLRSAAHSTLGISPGFAALGHDLVTPVDVNVSTRVGASDASVYAERFVVAQEIVKRAYAKYEAAKSKANEHRAAPIQYATGSLVWLKREAPAQADGVSVKLLARYTGPWQVTHVFNGGLDVGIRALVPGDRHMQRTRLQDRIVHCTKLKPWKVSVEQALAANFPVSSKMEYYPGDFVLALPSKTEQVIPQLWIAEVQQVPNDPSFVMVIWLVCPIVAGCASIRGPYTRSGRKFKLDCKCVMYVFTHLGNNDGTLSDTRLTAIKECYQTQGLGWNFGV
jgi:hypothetical protein